MQEVNKDKAYMRIIVANYRYFIAGGPERYMFKFMDAADKRGIEVIPFSVNNPQNVVSPYSKYFARPRSKQLIYSDTKKSVGNMIGFFRSVVWNWDAEKRITKLIRDTKPDAVYILHEINHLSPSIIHAAKKEKVKVIHRISDFFMFCPKYDFLCEDEICEACIQGDYSKAIARKCVKNSGIGTRLRVMAMKYYSRRKAFEEVDKFICTCEFSKNKLVEGGIPQNKIECIPTFIDSADIVPHYENNKYFLFLGRMAHQKGTIYAIEAMKYLADTDFVLKITGTLSDSDEDKTILKFIVDNKLEDKIVFTGFKQGKELDDLIERCTAVVCPAIWYENMPNTVIESYAHGKPVVASNIGSLAEIVEDGKTGLLFEMKNSGDLADKLRKLIDDEALCMKLGIQARLKVEREYSVDKHMDKLLSLI